MRDRFLSLVEQGGAAVEQLAESGEQEDVRLEFKTKAQAGHGRLEKPDARNLGKAISAFANSEGGLLIWGIKARKDPDTGIDCASEPAPIAEIELFKSQVNERLSDIVRPAHSAVEVALLRSSSEPSCGYLLVYVPRSDRRPHMSRAPDDHTYWRRAGAASLRMEHGDIEDAFTRRRVGALTPVHEQAGPGTIRTEGWYEHIGTVVRLGLRNDELVSARFPYLDIRLDRGFPAEPRSQLISENGLQRAEAGPERHRFRGNSNVVVHPGETLWAANVTVPVVRNVGDQTVYVDGRPASEAVITISLRFGALDQPQCSHQLHVDARELIVRPPRG